jgi:hypothetical protein
VSASYKVYRHLECYEQSNGEDIGFFTSRDAVCRFRLRLAVFRNDCRMTHSPCDKWDHPPTGFAPSSSAFRSSPRQRYTDGAFHGVYLFPSSRHQLPEAFFYVTRIPLLATFTSLAFRTLSTFFASGRLVGLFQPTATSRVHLQGFFPLTQPLKLVASIPAFSSLFRNRLHAVAHIRQLFRNRPQGFAPCENPFRFITVIHRDKRPFPSWFFLLQVFTRSDVPVPSHFLPPYTFMRLCRCHFRMWSLATVASIGLPFPRLPTCSRFGTFSPLRLATL